MYKVKFNTKAKLNNRRLRERERERGRERESSREQKLFTKRLPSRYRIFKINNLQGTALSEGLMH
jgi:hypothetical protein